MKNQILLCVVLCVGVAAAQDTKCDFGGYKSQDGLKAEVRGGVLEVPWTGERQRQLRAVFALRDGQPVVQELAARKNGGSWIVLAKNLIPEFEVTSGVRRLSEQQMAPMRGMKTELTPEVDGEGEMECVLGFAADGAGTSGHQHESACVSPRRSAGDGRNTTPRAAR